MIFSSSCDSSDRSDSSRYKQVVNPAQWLRVYLLILLVKYFSCKKMLFQSIALVDKEFEHGLSSGSEHDNAGKYINK